jgi:hypothetical protein
MSKTKTCVFKYKCRFCGEIFDGPVGGDTVAEYGLLSAVFDFDFPKKFIGIPPNKYDIHHTENHAGVGDLIGYTKE